MSEDLVEMKAEGIVPEMTGFRADIGEVALVPELQVERESLVEVYAVP